jgi:hypothetical protein
VLLLAQSPTGSIAGLVKDPSGAVVGGVDLSVQNQESGVVYRGQTDPAGRYELRALPQGRYRISASYQGFEAGDQQEALLNAGQAVSLNLTLQIQEVRQSVTVLGEASPLDVSSPHTSYLVNQIAAESLPLNGRSLEQLALLAPGMVPVRAKDARPANGFTRTISSSGSRGATFLLDGMNVQHAIFADDTPGGVSGLLLGLDAVEEFQVIPDAYPAYVGGTGGPVVSVLTRRGTRTFHGSAFEYFRDEALDARNFFDTTIPDFSRHQFGGWLGGPLPGQNRTFFASYEGLRERLGRTFFATVPDERARLGLLPGRSVQVSPAIQPILDRYPLPNGENFGDGSAAYSYQQVQPTDDHHLNARVDFALSPRDTLLARYTLQESSKVAPIEMSIPGFDNDLHSRNHYAAVELRRVFSSNLLNTLQVGLNRSGYESFSIVRPDLAEVPPLIPGRPVFGRLNVRGLSSFGTDTADLYFRMRQFEVTDSLLFTRGRHDWTFGANWKHYSSDGSYDFFFNGLLIYEDLAQFLTNRAQRFTGAEPGSDAHKRYRQDLMAFYVDDQFRWRPDVTVSVGVRYEPFTVPTEADGKLSNLRDLYDSTPTVGQLFDNPSWLNIAPRVGLAWNVGGRDRTVLRTGFGIFFDPIRENIFGYGARVQQPFVTVRTIQSPPYPNPSGGSRQGEPRQDSVEYDIATPYMMRYHLTLQRALTRNFTYRVGYVGSRGVHLPRVGDLNVSEPLRVESDGRLYFGTGRPQRRNPLFERVRHTSTDANSFYNALQLGFTRRWDRGVQFDFNYSFARSVDDASAYRRSFTNSVADVPPYYYDRKMDRGLSNFHIAHSAVFGYTWDLPSRDGGGVAAALLRNWRTAGFVTVSSGYPFSLNVSFDIGNNGVREGHRPNLVPGASNNPVLGGPDRYFDVSAFELQQLGYLGDLGRNTLLGPGYASVDVMLMRRLALTSRQGLELRLEVFNLLNRANFAAPQNSGTGGVILFNNDTGVPVGNAAKIFSTAGTARQLQLGVRWTF